jgi:hypothetical protein
MRRRYRLVRDAICENRSACLGEVSSYSRGLDFSESGDTWCSAGEEPHFGHPRWYSTTENVYTGSTYRERTPHGTFQILDYSEMALTIVGEEP